MGVLYIVAGPIGHLGDSSYRAGNILASVDIVLAEDTRTARKLLNHLNVSANIVSYNEHNHRQRLPMTLSALSAGDIALVSDAGTPSISDPGARLIDEVWTAGFRVTPVPGASAVIAAMSASGFSASPFEFIGFWPRSSGQSSMMIDRLSTSDTIVAFESPSRLGKTLQALARSLPERRLLIAREMTKLHEELLRGTCGELSTRFSDRSWRGEVTLVIEAAPKLIRRTGANKESARDAELKERARQISKQIGVSRLHVHRVLLALENDGNI